MAKCEVKGGEGVRDGMDWWWRGDLAMIIDGWRFDRGIGFALHVTVHGGERCAWLVSIVFCFVCVSYAMYFPLYLADATDGGRERECE